ncbi:MAG: NAD(P)H-dependent flavin oxidoreductase [Propionicimonas sp.]
MALPETLVGRLRLPVVAAPMFLVSGTDLVVAACRAGVLGTFPALNQRSTAGLDEWLSTLDAALGREAAPYGVNLIVHRTNARVAADLEVIVRHRVPVVITSLGAVSEVVAAVHSYGGVVFHDVTTAHHARKAAEAGVDGLILVAAGAGGHGGSLSPFAFLADVRATFAGTILLAGAISSGSDVLAARAMGADLAYLGTRFVATTESMASDAYREQIIRATAADIVYTPSVSTIPANFLRRSLELAGLDPDEAPGPVDLTHVTNPSQSDAKAWRDIWSAGQGVAGIDTVLPVADVVDQLAREYANALARLRTEHWGRGSAWQGH